MYATIIVAALAAVTGFFIGLLAGLWTGPGAFASAIAAGYLAANLVLAGSGALGIFTGILSHYMLSQDTPAVVALEQVNKLATTWEEKNALQQEFSHGVKCSMFGYMHTKEYYLEKKNKDKNNSKSLKLAKECLTQLEEGSTINELLSKTTLPQKGSFFSLMEEVKKENQYISLCEHKMNIDYHSIKLIS